jgi:hypothetical protein
MPSCGVFKVDLFIKGKKFTDQVNVIQELNENIIGIGFIHAHKLTCDVISRRVKFAGARTNTIAALKNSVTRNDLHSSQGKIQRDQR